MNFAVITVKKVFIYSSANKTQEFSGLPGRTSEKVL
jgi:hypothetical protein